MDNKYRYNHYVPIWYQKNFIPVSASKGELIYLRLKPLEIRNKRGKLIRIVQKSSWPPVRCFAQDDLYTTRFGEVESREIEKQFFGAIDTKGKEAVDHLLNYTPPDWRPEPISNLVTYMSTQKLRTKKGLDWLTRTVGAVDSNRVLLEMLRLRDVFSATWTECIWEIADADQSTTKFIVSDHPITIYNRKCGPRNPKWCKGANDPDIRLMGSHTIFPLSLNKVLILTNVAWARNPYQSSLNLRPNPTLYRSTMWDFGRIHVGRHLSEVEVRQINFVIKSRAYEHIAAGKEEWLHPEEFVSKSDWPEYGDGLLLMPDPRSLNYGGEMFAGFANGGKFAVDSYGRTPRDPDFGKSEFNGDMNESPLYSLKGEFARRFGPTRRGRTVGHADMDPEVDNVSTHEYYLTLGKKKNGKFIKYR